MVDSDTMLQFEHGVEDGVRDQYCPLSSTPPASSRDAKKLGAWKAVSRKP